jgi:hypothetical protein
MAAAPVRARRAPVAWGSLVGALWRCPTSSPRLFLGR